MKRKKSKEIILEVGTKSIKVGPQAVPSRPGKSPEDFIRALKKAIKDDVFRSNPRFG